jgi:acyl-CoA reductase-like NAD-dependent aldehyde dehydrogenase
VKPKAEAKALDKAVKALARTTEKSWSNYTAEQQTQKLRDLMKLMASFSKRRRRTKDSNHSV